jgi:hypothetical protein
MSRRLASLRAEVTGVDISAATPRLPNSGVVISTAGKYGLLGPAAGPAAGGRGSPSPGCFPALVGASERNLAGLG